MSASDASGTPASEEALSTELPTSGGEAPSGPLSFGARISPRLAQELRNITASVAEAPNRIDARRAEALPATR